ncbi:MAG TPA: S8 family serine peptidase, partial [Aggregatilineales bacterium]|nr:S8 family serine peptidase [Aggregatilineales bacterium]
NFGISFIHDTFRDEDGDGFHEFAPDLALMWAAPMFSEMFGETHLRWQDNYTSAEIDLDLYVFAADRISLLAASTEVQRGGSADWPYEDVFYSTQAGEPIYLAVRAKIPGEVPEGTPFYIYADDTILGVPSEDGSITAPADSSKIISVGAIEASETIWQRSGRGPTWDGRIKPDLVAPTRLKLESTDEIFTGTSASSPIVAGAAAIIRAAFPELSEVEVRHYLLTQAVDLGDEGPDNSFGYGRVWLPPPQ